MERIQSIDNVVIKYINLNTYPIVLRDLKGEDMFVNAAWNNMIGETKINSDKANDLLPNVQEITSSIFDSIIQNHALILHETINGQTYIVHRSPIMYKHQRCLLIQYIA